MDGSPQSWAARHPALAVGLASTAFVVAVFGIGLVSGAMAPVDLLVAGRIGPSVEVITEDFGAPTNPRPGYDGQQVYAIARAFPDLGAAGPHLDAARYRALRIGQSALASPAPDGAPLVLALLGWGAVGVGLAAGAVADLAGRHGRDPRVGLLAVPVLVLPVLITTNEALAYGAALLAVALLDRGRLGWAVVAGSAAALTKESALVVLGAAALGALLTERRWQVLLVAIVPAAVLAGWWVALGSILPGSMPSRFDPLGLLALSPAGMALAVGVVALGLAGAWWWRDVPALALVGVAFAAWVLTFNVDVLDPWALLRVAAPAVLLGATGGLAAARAAWDERHPPAAVTAGG